MRRLFMLLTSLLFLTTNTNAQSALVNYTFWDTVRYADANYTATETYFSDLNDDLKVAGYYRNNSGNYTGFVYDYKKGTFATYQHPGYNHTEITGINDAGKLLGRAYSSPLSAIAITGEYVNGSIQNVQPLTWFATSASSQWPKKVNNMDMTTGSVQSGSTRWLHLQEFAPPFNNQSTQRVQISATQYNTYGSGLNDNGLYCGYYLDGSEWVPLIWDDNNIQFYINIPHKNQSVALKRTVIRDINNQGYVVVDYRDSSNVMQGTVGKASLSNLNNVTYESYQNSIFGDSKSPWGSGFEGINNNNDIVGYYKISSNEPVGFIGLTEGSTPEIPNVYQDTVNQFDRMINSRQYFYYDTVGGTFSYSYGSYDPWAGQSDNLISKLQQLNIGIDYFKYDSNKVYPSWYAYVWAQGEADSYIINGSTKIPKIGALMKWNKVKNYSFKGSCSGISIFWLQHMKNVSTLTNRFNGIQTTNDIDNYFLGFSSPASHFTKEAMNALQLYQFRPAIVQKYMDSISSLVTSSPTSLKSEYLSLARSLYNIDSVRMIGMRYDVSGAFHATVPIRATREFKLNGRDTLHTMNPNYNNQWTQVVVDPSIPPVQFQCREHYVDQNNNTQTLTVPYLSAALQLHEADITNTSQPVFKTLNNETIVGVNQICNFRVEDASNSNLSFERMGTSETKQFPAMKTIIYDNDDNLTDELFLPTPTDLKTTISGGCNSKTFWNLSYGNGDKTFSRTNVLPNETDIIYHSGNVMRIENPDAVDKYMHFNVIYNPNNTESFVSIDSFRLSQNDTVRYETIDQHNYLLSNGYNTTNNYNLFVHHLSSSEYFVWNTKSINIAPTTNHIIRLRPTMNGQEVIILVDSMQDGIIDDSITVVNVGLHTKELNKQYNLNIYPNPTSAELNISLDKLPEDDYTIVLYNKFGQSVLSQELNHQGGMIRSKVNTSQLANGLYLVHIQSEKSNIKLNQKVMIRH